MNMKKHTQIKELKVVARQRLSETESAFFRLQQAFFQESPMETGYDVRRFQRLTLATHALLGKLEEWHKSETKIISCMALPEPQPDFPENNMTPTQIAEEYTRIAIGSTPESQVLSDTSRD